MGSEWHPDHSSEAPMLLTLGRDNKREIVILGIKVIRFSLLQTLPLTCSLHPRFARDCSWSVLCVHWASQLALVVKNPPANAGDLRDMGWILGLGRSPGEGNSNPLQYSCLENPMDRGAWWDTVHGVTKSWTRLKQLSTQT